MMNDASADFRPPKSFMHMTQSNNMKSNMLGRINILIPVEDYQTCFYALKMIPSFLSCHYYRPHRRRQKLVVTL